MITVLPNFHMMIQNQFGTKIRRFRSDNTRDYFNQILSPYFHKERIIHESSCINTPQQNGVAERKNGHLLNTTRALLFHQNVPKQYWGEAVLTYAYIINRIPSRVLGSKSPMEVLSKFYPDISATNTLTPRIFGCTSFVHVHSNNRGKLDPRAIKCVFVEYPSTQKCYKCFHPPTRKLYISTDVTFAEGKPYFTEPYLQGKSSIIEDKDFFQLDLPPSSSSQSPSSPLVSNSRSTSVNEFISNTEPVSPVLFLVSPVLSPVSPEQDNRTLDHTRYGKGKVYSRKQGLAPDLMQAQVSNPISENEVTVSKPNFMPLVEHQLPETQTIDQDLPIAVRKGTRECTKRPLYPLTHFVSFEKFSPTHRNFLTSLNEISIPNNLSEALSNGEWRKAMRTEMDALEKNGTWELVDLPKGKKTVGCKWAFSLKYKADGSLEHYKARLVAKGYT